MRQTDNTSNTLVQNKTEIQYLMRMLDFLFNDEGMKKGCHAAKKKVSIERFGMASNTGMNIINYTEN